MTVHRTALISALALLALGLCLGVAPAPARAIDVGGEDGKTYLERKNEEIRKERREDRRESGKRDPLEPLTSPNATRAVKPRYAPSAPSGSRAPGTLPWNVK